MEKMVKKAFVKTRAPRGYRNQLLGVLLEDGSEAGHGRSLWLRPGLWALVSAVITISILAYGLWLPSHLQL